MNHLLACEQHNAFATELYAAACSVDDGPSCAILGDRLLAGIGAPADAARAQAAHARACRLGERAWCRERGGAP